MTRLLLRVAAVLIASSMAHGVAQGRADNAPYAQVGRLPSVVDSESLVNFVFDPVGRRLYAQSLGGVYWVDVRAREPHLNGPILPSRSGAIEIAPDLGRLYFSIDEEKFGYLNLLTSAPPKTLVGREWRGGRLVYEPTRKEIYTPTRFRGETMAIYDADTGERAAEVRLPGYRVTALEAVPGKVFFSVENKSGLYVIDAATHSVAPWPINGQLVTPAQLEADPAGQYLIGQYERHVVAIDIPSATVVARLTTAGPASFAFDPASRMLVVAAREHPDHPRVRLRTYSLTANGFTQVAELKNPSEDQAGLYSMHGGFLQRGHRSLFLWLAGQPLSLLPPSANPALSSHPHRW
jgi:hypothetical protein